MKMYWFESNDEAFFVGTLFTIFRSRYKGFPVHSFCIWYVSDSDEFLSVSYKRNKKYRLYTCITLDSRAQHIFVVINVL
jgi:hypothetical protein